MKAVIAPNSPRRTDWLQVFGPGPMEVEPLPMIYVGPDGDCCRIPLDRYRLVLRGISILNKRRLVGYIARRNKIPVDAAAAQIEQRGCTILASDLVLLPDDELRF
jgi:hypothetical protein